MYDSTGSTVWVVLAALSILILEFTDNFIIVAICLVIVFSLVLHQQLGRHREPKGLRPLSA